MSNFLREFDKKMTQIFQHKPSSCEPSAVDHAQPRTKALSLSLRGSTENILKINKPDTKQTGRSRNAREAIDLSLRGTRRTVNQIRRRPSTMAGGLVDRDEITAPMSRVFVYPNETKRDETRRWDGRTRGRRTHRSARSAEFRSRCRCTDSRMKGCGKRGKIGRQVDRQRDGERERQRDGERETARERKVAVG